MPGCPLCGEQFDPGIAYCPKDGTALRPTIEPGGQADPMLGTTIDGRYRVDALIGEGGMGRVYSADHTVLKRRLAIKLIQAAQAKDQTAVQRFIQEAQTTTAIGHPNIIDIVDFGHLEDGAVYFVMEFLEGETLADVMERGPLGRDVAMDVVDQIASALAASHEIGVVHRDLKPDNVFLIKRDGKNHFVKVLDFGIAKVMDSTQRITRTGMVFGTPHYMAPEQAAGQAVDRRSDVYALGVMMYQLFAGRLPFDAPTYMEVMTKQMYESPPRPSDVEGKVDSPLEKIILKALAKKPEDRFQSMHELRDALTRLRERVKGRAQTTVKVGVELPPSPLPGSDSLHDPATAPTLYGEPDRHAPAPTTVPEIAPPGTEEVSLPRRRIARPVAAVALAVLAGAVGLWALSGSDGPSAEPAAVATPTASPAPKPEPAQPTQPVEVPEPVVASERVSIAVEPVGAQLFVDDALIGETEAEIARPQEGDLRIEVRMLGHAAKSIRVDPNSPDNIRVELEPVAAERGQRRKARPQPRPKKATGQRRAQPARALADDLYDPWR